MFGGGITMETKLTLNLHRVDNRKSKAKSTLIVDLLKKYNIPGGQAVRMFHENGPEYIVRKCHQLDFFKEKYLMRNDGFGIKDERRWLIASINNQYDEFKDWYKRRQDEIVKNGPDELRDLLNV
jgi:hypothetical protein